MTEWRVLTPGEYLKEAGDYARTFDSDFGIKTHYIAAVSVLVGKDEKGRRVEKFFDRSNNLIGKRTVDGFNYEVVKYLWGERRPDCREIYDRSGLIRREWLGGPLNGVTRSIDFLRDKLIKREYGWMGHVNKEIVEEKNKTIEKTLDRKGRVKKEKTTILDGKEGKVVTLKDGKGKLIRKKVITVDTNASAGKKVETETVTDGKGKIIHQRVYVKFQGKEVLMEPTRGLFSKIKGRLFGKKSDRGGAVLYRRYNRYSYLGIPRKSTCKELDAILKNGSLSGSEKRALMRKKVAEFRDQNSVEAPNKKVGKKLKNYLPQKKERR